jgi:DNA adenine methylase
MTGDIMILEAFGNRIKYIRELKSMSQNTLAELTGIMREQISKIENGQTNPTLETVHKISSAFEMNMSSIFDFPLENPKDNLERLKFKPFLKWAGGKTQLLDKIKALLPKEYNTYYEPFVGGGALFFNSLPDKAIISDYNNELITTYKCFSNNNDYLRLIEELELHQINHDEEYYYKVRELDRTVEYLSHPAYKIAARMIYLNKTCFNGLYRVNSKGYFNVPSGKYDKANIFDRSLMDNIHNYISKSNIRILQGDFEEVVSSAKKSDFVYFDPPYDTFDEQNNFTSYTKESFDKNEQLRLSEVFKALDKKGVYLMLSNHNTRYINSLYKDFNIHIIPAKRFINSKAAGRGNVEEVIITNY